MASPAPSMLKPTLIGGFLFGVLAGLPGLNIVNICTCCSMVVAAGFVASYLYSAECKRVGSPFQVGNGAVVGLIAGAFYALAATIVAAIVQMTVGAPVLIRLLEWLQQHPEVPPESAEMIDQALERLSGLVDLLQVEPIIGAEISGMHVAAPLIMMHRQQGINTGIQLIDFLRAEGVFQHDEAT